MKNGIWTIARKELARFFGDKRTVFSAVLLPGLIIYIMYSFMGSAITKMTTADENYRFRVDAVNLPASVSTLLPEEQFELTEIGADAAEESRAEITDKARDLLLVFPENFDAAVAAYTPEQGAAPQVEVYFNSADTESAAAYQAVRTMLDLYESALANRFDVNAGAGTFDLASEKDTTGTIFSSMLPMLLMIFLFSGCMSVAPEAIAGEKERGTMATMLVTPTRRSEIAIGKIVALSIIALLSGASSTLGTLLSLPKLMGAASDSMSAAYYTASDYAVLTAVILSTVLLLVALISVLSAWAKTIKEAQTTVMPLMMVVMLLGVSAMFGGGPKTELYYYCIPLYNSVQAMVGIFSFEAAPAAMVVTVCANLVYACIAGFVLTKLFNSEKVMFRR